MKCKKIKGIKGLMSHNIKKTSKENLNFFLDV